MLPGIAAVSLTLALPVYLHAHIHIPLAKTPHDDYDDDGGNLNHAEDPFYNIWEKISFCIEDWNYGGEWIGSIDLVTNYEEETLEERYVRSNALYYLGKVSQ